MSKYTKLMKKFKNGMYHIDYLELTDLSKFGKYPDLMKNKYNDGYNQIIINSFLMIEIMEEIRKKEDWILLDMDVSDPSVDEDTLANIKTIFKQIKENNNDFSVLKEYLFWALDEGSIFIDKISIFNTIHAIKVEINSNGLIFGENNILVLDNIVLPLLDGYLNE